MEASQKRSWILHRTSTRGLYIVDDSFGSPAGVTQVEALDVAGQVIRQQYPVCRSLSRDLFTLQLQPRRRTSDKSNSSDTDFSTTSASPKASFRSRLSASVRSNRDASSGVASR